MKAEEVYGLTETDVAELRKREVAALEAIAKSLESIARDIHQTPGKFDLLARGLQGLIQKK